jgi:transcription initiation factor TFIIH subunit 1
MNVTAPFPDIILEQMRSCHNAANEFLRQYWSAILPNPTAPTLSAAAKTARATKAAKMAGYLRVTDRKVEAVVHTATIAGVDPERVRAVSHLISRYRSLILYRRWHR